MDRKKHIALNFLGGFLFLVLMAPLLLDQFHILKPVSLNGVVVQDSTNVAFSAANWLDGSFQESINNKVQDGISVRADLIRLNNQLDHTVFKTTNANVVIGKNGYLFERPYIESYYGRDIPDNFSTDSMIGKRVEKLKFIQSELEKRGKHLLVIYEPSKVRFMPEYIPDNLKWGANDMTVYDTYIKWSRKTSLQYMDMNGWFLSMKHTAKHQLFGKPGIHWTAYGALIAADSLGKYMEARGKEKCRIVFSDNEKGRLECPYYGENDLLKLLNLMSMDNSDTFYHPTVHFYPDYPKKKNTAIYISDSFMWIWAYLYVPHHLHSSFQFWSYYSEAWIPGNTGPVPLSKINRMEACMKSDWIILSFTEINYLNYGCGFPEEMYNYLIGQKSYNHTQAI